MNITELSINEIISLLTEKKLSVKELVTQYINKIEANRNLNLTSETFFEKALKEAEKSDNKEIKDRLPLEGIPIAVKDLFCTKDQITSASSNMLKNFRSPYESTVTQNLKDSGAIVLCKTNMDEFAMGSASDTCNIGKVINPWTNINEKPLTPGGSSGGSAGITALNGVCFSIGSDTGGSIRQPAAFCGVVGLKPTYGRCSRFGMVAFASSLDQAGPITKSVDDAAYALKFMSSYDDKDSTSSKEQMPDLFSKLNDGVKGLKVGIPKEYNLDNLSSEIKNLWATGEKWLKDNGAETKEINLTHTTYALPAYYIIAPAEASANLARYDGVKYGFRAKGTFKTIDEMYCATRAQGFGKEVKRRLLIGTYVLSSGYYDAYYLRAQKVRRKIINDFENVFKDVDLILTPTAPSEAFHIGEKNDPIDMYLNDIFTVPASLAGLPAISIPAGLGINKKPLGLQLIGKSFQEDILLRAAKTIEKCANFKKYIGNKSF